MKEKLSTQILKKDFTIRPNGWDVKEVDVFLDEIMNKVKELEKQMGTLEQENQRLNELVKILENKNEDLKIEITKAKSQKNVSFDPNDYTNVEIIRRLAKLETAVNDMKQELTKKTNLG